MFSYSMTISASASCNTAAAYSSIPETIKCPMGNFVLLAPAVDCRKVIRSASTLHYLKMGSEDTGSDLPLVLEIFCVQSWAEPSH